MSLSKNVIEISGYAHRSLQSNSGYGSTGNFRIAFATKVIGGKRYQLSREQTCRDYSHEFIREAFLQLASGKVTASGNGLGYYPFENKKMDTDKLRLLVFSSGNGVYKSGAKPIVPKNKDSYTTRTPIINIDEKEVQKRLYFGKRIINLYEGIFGWTKSKIVKAKHFKNNDCWHVMGPKEWMHNPHMLSLLTITLRVAVRYGTFDFKTVDDIVENYKKFTELYGADRGIIISMLDFLPVLINKRADVFDGFDKKDLFHMHPKGRLMGFHSSGGISSLCSGCTGVKELNERVLRMKAEQKKSK